MYKRTSIRGLVYLLSVFAICILGSYIAGCKNDPAAPKYPPPVDMGQGHMFLFSASDADDFHNRLNEHINRTGLKVLRIDTFKIGSNDYRYLVAMGEGPQPIPPVTLIPQSQPTTKPAIVNGNGEITYPQ
jgi:hypothetical protein